MSAVLDKETQAMYTAQHAARTKADRAHRDKMIREYNIQNVSPCEIYPGRHHGPRKEFTNDSSMHGKASLVWNILRQDTHQRWSSKRLSRKVPHMGCHKTALKVVKSMIMAGWASYCREQILPDVPKSEYDPRKKYGGTRDCVIILHDSPLPEHLRNVEMRRVYGKDFYRMTAHNSPGVEIAVDENGCKEILSQFQGQKGHYYKKKKTRAKGKNTGGSKVEKPIHENVSEAYMEQGLQGQKGGGGGRKCLHTTPSEKETQTLKGLKKELFEIQTYLADKSKAISQDELPEREHAQYDEYVSQRIKPNLKLPEQDTSRKWNKLDRRVWVESSLIGAAFLALCKPGEEWDTATARVFSKRLQDGFITPRQIVEALMNPLSYKPKLKQILAHTGHSNAWILYREDVENSKGFHSGRVAEKVARLVSSDQDAASWNEVERHQLLRDGGCHVHMVVPAITNYQHVAAWCLDMHDRGRHSEIPGKVTPEHYAGLAGYIKRSPVAMEIYAGLGDAAQKVFPGLGDLLAAHHEYVRLLNIRAVAHGLPTAQPVAPLLTQAA